MDNSAIEPATLFEEAAGDKVSPVADAGFAPYAVRSAPFDDGKDPQALRTIGEVAKALSLRPHVLRYWEEQFPALQPIKRSGNRRYYRPQDIALIMQINRLVHGEGYTLRGAARAIEENAPGRQKAVPAKVEQRSVEAGGNFLRRLASIREELAEALARC